MSVDCIQQVHIPSGPRQHSLTKTEETEPELGDEGRRLLSQAFSKPCNFPLAGLKRKCSDTTSEVSSMSSDAESSDEDIQKQHLVSKSKRLRSLVEEGGTPGRLKHFICEHGRFAPGTSCVDCNEEAQQRALAALSKSYKIARGVFGQLAVIWRTDSDVKQIDYIRQYSAQWLCEMLEVCYKGERLQLRNLALNTDLFWSAVYLRDHFGTTGNQRLDRLFSRASE